MVLLRYYYYWFFLLLVLFSGGGDGGMLSLVEASVIPVPGKYPICNICPTGQRITAPLAVVTLGGQRFNCLELKLAGLGGTIRPALCSLIPYIKIRKTCGCLATPVKAPVKTPVKTPVQVPVNKPVKAPVKAPVRPGGSGG